MASWRRIGAGIATAIALSLCLVAQRAQ